jgi:L-ascorbate metabolism protein UlaG (beta-lactamase superfamily)
MESDGQITFIGTATVLIQFSGFTILTDPNFLHRGERAYVGMGLSTRRLTDPALTIDQLPPLDLVVLSHHHGDHFDRRAASDLGKDVPIATEPHAARKLRRQGFTRPVALNTWQRWTLDGRESSVDITSLPAKHAPAPLDRVLPPVMGSLIDFRHGDELRYRIYLTGDTLYIDDLAEIARRFGDIDLCCIHLGGTRIAGVLLTMDGRQGVQALRSVRPRRAIPIHYDDYGLFKSPLGDFQSQAVDAGLETELVYLQRGDTYRFSSARPITNT